MYFTSFHISGLSALFELRGTKGLDGIAMIERMCIKTIILPSTSHPTCRQVDGSNLLVSVLWLSSAQPKQILRIFPGKN
jgi:hypothetical protein